MSETQGPGGGALEPHPFGGYGHPPSSGKDPYSPPSTTTAGNNGHGLTDISGDAQLSLLKNNSGLNTFTSFADPDGLGTRISDGFMEMRYIELGNWDLGGYTAEGLTARLIDSRSLTDSPDNIIQYRPWEKPDSSSPNTLTSITTTSSSPSGPGQGQLILTTNGNVITTSAGPVPRGGKSSPPPTLTTLTNAFPTFSDAFGPNGQKLPSFQSQFNSFNETATLIHPAQHHLGNNGDILPAQGATTLPSFHTLPANRGYMHPGGPPHPGLLSATPIQARDLPNIQQQFLDERHIQLFPLGTTAMTALPVTSGHHGGISIPNGNGHHFVTTTNGMNGGQPHFVTTNHAQPSQHLIEFVPISQMQLHAAAAGPHGHYPSSVAHPHAKLQQTQTTDGTSIPGLNLNDLHHTHSNLNLNLNVPPSTSSSVIGKYISSDGTLETLIAVNKTPPPGSAAFDPHHQQNHHHQSGQGQQNNIPQHHHHQIIKLEHPGQNSPQIVSNSTNGNGNSIGGPQNGTNATNGKRQQKRKRNGGDSSAADSFSQQQQHLHNNNHHNHHLVNSSTNNNSTHDLNSDPQVSSVSSSDSDFKRPNLGLNGGLDLNGGGSDPGGLDKPVKKKRKRCGECVGCQRKDNCGDCAPCRNDKSHQICKMRRCEKLTEKKSRVGRVAVAIMT